MIFTQRHVCYLPSHPKCYHSVVSLSRCQTLRQDVASRVTSHHLKPASQKEGHSLTGREQLFTNFACSCVALGGVYALSHELYRRTNLRPTFAASLAGLFIQQTRRHRGAVETFDSSEREVYPFVHAACFGGKTLLTAALRHNLRVVSSIIQTPACVKVEADNQTGALIREI